MLQYAARRLVSMVVMLFFVSIAAFIIIQLPPGDFLTTLVAGLRAGPLDRPGAARYLKERYGLDQPIWIQYCAGSRASCCTAISAIRSNGSGRSPT